MTTSKLESNELPLEQYTNNYLDYIKNVKARSPNTIAAYLQDLNCFSRYLSADMASFTELSEHRVLSYLKFLRHVQQLKPATVRRRILTVQGFCNWLTVYGILSEDPFENLSLDLKVPKRLPRPVDPLTIRHLILKSHELERDVVYEQREWVSSSHTSQRQTTLLVIQLMLATGVRVGEVSVLRKHDISSDGKAIHILGKGNKERLVYVENIQLANALAQHRLRRIGDVGEGESLFVNRRGCLLTPQVIRKRVKLMCADTGASDIPTPHRFRHSAATLLIENGVDIRVVQRLLGHASITTTELYTQVSDVSLRDALRKADVLRQFQ